MLRRLTTLLTITLLAATTLAGSAPHAGGHKCPMHAAMDCCANEQSAAATEAAPEIKAALLICALNCQQGAPTAPGFKVSQPQPTQAQPQSVAASAPVAPPQPPAARAPSVNARAPGSPPAYIRHLALLI